MVTRVLASPPDLLPGRATIVGTDSFIRLFDKKSGEEHFRRLVTNVPEVGDLLVSSVGIGTHTGHETDEVDAEYRHAITRAIELGINIIDTSVSFRSMRSERAVGWALAEAVARGMITRDQIVVCTKGGYLTFECDRPAYNLNPHQWIDNTYFRRGIIESWSDVVGDCHCIAPKFLKNQVERSRRNLGLETIDVYYIHNPEEQLNGVSRGEFNARMEAAFKALEEETAAGHITCYGVSTWKGFRVPPQDRQYLSLDDLVTIARSVGGADHHFRVAMVPFNLYMRETAEVANQWVEDEQKTIYAHGKKHFDLDSFLGAAKHYGIQVIASAVLGQGKLTGYVGEIIRDHNLPVQVLHCIADLGDGATDAQCAMQFARTTPGIITAMAGMRHHFHVDENAEVIKRIATYQYHPNLNIDPFSWSYGN
ncbi:uncharacterized protein MPTK1_3g02820 [Marchantia polymorpha subsp. ruderalis]|uniref:NADP-dependent oxidoreductase domain-containing protein n=2 Tax=Marchantia polymorpha TaxID=3197 RepID=A0AAF6AWU4_MARPO|nr:hypothetical protein MARPO_0007s0270 [Marchantia polymorpha]BBN04228.1 hypothetical protein Mp_3g02820 [Marchantia polymorpha subsp. ruderalis]|eukprot:PTQ47915.1 hypothetical protein MARPO_0007s0270 [Marchantia polymorpha]